MQDRTQFCQFKNEENSRNSWSQRLYRKRINTLTGFSSHVTLSFLYSRSNSGTRISDLYPDLTTVCEMVLTDQPEEVDILFLCLPHKESQNWLTQNPVKEETLVIDLGNDFRLDGNFETEILSTDCLKSIKTTFRQKALPIRDVLQQQFSWHYSIGKKVVG
jgi:hypothetical protein